MVKNKRKIKRHKNLGSPEVPRVVFCRSNRYIRIQAVDDSNSHTLISLSSQDLKNQASFSCKNKNYTLELAAAFAEQLRNKGYKKIVFDRNGKRYHGNVEAFCEVIRKSGIEF